MFDESEIRFLNRAVDLQLLTPNQRQRLVAFQHQVPPNMNVTQLVADAGLMVADEVAQVLGSLASVVSMMPTAPATRAQLETPAAQAVTHDSFAQIMAEEEAEEQHELARTLASAVHTVLHDHKTPPDDPSYNTIRENMEAAQMQKFPLPGGQNAETSGMGAEVDDVAMHMPSGLTTMQGAAEQPPIPESPLKHFAMSANEMDELLGETPSE